MKEQKNRLTVDIIVDFTANDLERFIKSSKDLMLLTRKILYNQTQLLIHKYKKRQKIKDGDILLIWTLPDKCFLSYSKALENEKIVSSQKKQEIEAYLLFLKNISSKYKYVFHPTWVDIKNGKSNGPYSLKKRNSPENLIKYFNEELINFSINETNFFALDSLDWQIKSSTKFDHKLWYLTKIYFNKKIQSLFYNDIKKIISAKYKSKKKVLVIDLDNTIWGGILGDDGYKNLRIGGHDEVGEAFLDFQKKIKSYKNKGVIICIASKNSEKNVREAFKKIDDNYLKLEDFAIRKINWKSKSSNMRDIIKDINVKEDSIIFLDDSHFERKEIKNSYKKIICPVLPGNKLLYPKFINELEYFEFLENEDDRKRNIFYADEEKRKKVLLKSNSNGWIKKLNLHAYVEKFKLSNLNRIEQLMNKTNQMNLKTRRLSSKEICKWNKSRENMMYSFKLKDNFGSYGLVGIMSYSIKKNTLNIEDYILSCRAFSRGLERLMLHVAYRDSKRLKLKKIVANFKVTKNNEPCMIYFNNEPGFLKKNNNYSFDTSKKISVPNFLKHNFI